MVATGRRRQRRRRATGTAVVLSERLEEIIGRRPMEAGVVVGHAGRTITQPVKPMLSVDSLPRNRDHEGSHAATKCRGEGLRRSKQNFDFDFYPPHSGEKVGMRFLLSDAGVGIGGDRDCEDLWGGGGGGGNEHGNWGIYRVESHRERCCCAALCRNR